ncbi:tetratricopeptide repeat protein [Desulfococcaceae bacterium HSG8]|nr:tetratricopeptide repeat protein [Desulfococcaceae bacterium HSG8]
MEQKDSYHYYRIGLEYFESGELESALESFLRSSESEPHFKTCVRTAHVLRELKRFEEADRFLEQAYRLNPKNDKTGIEYAELMLKRGQTFPAKKILNDIIRRNPTYGPARRLLTELVNENDFLKYEESVPVLKIQAEAS